MLKAKRLMINLHVPCAQNKMLTKKQIAMLIHIEDLTLAHTHELIVAEFVEKLDSEHGLKDSLIDTREKIGEFLGMIINFSNGLGVVVRKYDSIMNMWL